MGASPAGAARRDPLPWYERGGMGEEVDVLGTINHMVPPIFLALCFLPPVHAALWFTSYFALISYQRQTTWNPKRTYQPWLHIAVPLYVAALPLCAVAESPLLVAALCWPGIVLKNGLMSVCLHRYSAHGAFRCGTWTNAFVCFLGCLANQGGPIWWGSKHRCHHKFCDKERDPHSPLMSGAINAFQFPFLKHNKRVDEEFRPMHCDSFPARLLDTFAFAPVTFELLLAYVLGGPGGLWLSYTTGVLNQAGSLWFNVMNHPPQVLADGAQVCVAYDTTTWLPYDFALELSPNLLFRFFSVIATTVSAITGEAAHEHHHDHTALARRPGIDLPYHLLVRPLQAAGLIWKVRLSSDA
uniref:Fatty acid desaturase domain-containing protein n=1 Tax=Haptolina brevifila TaxID=156173 RepID=A0A7S2CFG0_9EUKA